MMTLWMVDNPKTSVVDELGLRLKNRLFLQRGPFLAIYTSVRLTMGHVNKMV